MKFLIGSYFELYQGIETSHSEALVEAEDDKAAKAESHRRYGWGSWATSNPETIAEYEAKGGKLETETSEASSA